MATVQAQAERRHFSRITFHRPADLTIGKQKAACEVLDVSLKGALVEVPAAHPCAVGERCTLLIRLDGADAIIQMDGVVAHRRGTSVGVRCTAIDMESIGHLRRLVEVNLGEAELLYRELAALAGQTG